MNEQKNNSNSTTYKQKLGEATGNFGKAIFWVISAVALTAVVWVCWVGRKGLEYAETKAQQGRDASASHATANAYQAGSDVKEAYRLRKEAQKAKEETTRIDEGFAESEINEAPLSA